MNANSSPPAVEKQVPALSDTNQPGNQEMPGVIVSANEPQVGELCDRCNVWH